MLDKLFWPIEVLCNFVIKILSVLLKPFGIHLGNRIESFDLLKTPGVEALKTWTRRKIMSDSHYNKMKRDKKYESFTPPHTSSPPSISPPSISPPAVSPPSISPNAFTPSPTAFTPSPSP